MDRDDNTVESNDNTVDSDVSWNSYYCHANG